MGERKCVLCEGYIVNGRCRDCGMNYKREKVYRLNGETRRVQVGKKGSEERNKNRPETRKAYTQKPSTQLESDIQKKIEHWHPAAMNGRRVKKRSPISVVIAVIIVIGILSSVLEWFFRTVSDLSSGNVEVSTAESAYEEYDYDPYLYVTEELSEEGDSITQILQPGTYVGGYHLPEGRYEIKAMEGYGSVVLEDTNDMPYLWEYLAAEPISEDEKTSTRDFRLFTGWTLRIMPGVVIEVSSDNAQTDIQDRPEGNPLNDTVKIQNGMIAGLDFPAGVYDMRAAGEYGSIVIKRGEQEIINTFLEADTLSDSYRNLTLEINDEIVVEEAYSAEGFEVHLEPSAEIYPE